MKRVGEFAEVVRVMAAAMTRGAEFDVCHKSRPVYIDSRLNYVH